MAVTHGVERERQLTASNTSLSSQLQALRITNASLQLDNSALSEHLSSLTEHRDVLARRCDQLEVEKDALAAKCDQLETDKGELAARVALLEVGAADNKVMRSKIALLRTESDLPANEKKEPGQRAPCREYRRADTRVPGQARQP